MICDVFYIETVSILVLGRNHYSCYQHVSLDQRPCDRIRFDINRGTSVSCSPFRSVSLNEKKNELIIVLDSGWIHAVFTPCDSLVVGGNFLHPRAITMQQRVMKQEMALKVI